MFDARFSHLYFCQSLNRQHHGLSAIAELLVTFGGSYFRASFGQNPSRNATVRVPTEEHTDRLTDANRFYNVSMLYAIAIGGQIIRKLWMWSIKGQSVFDSKSIRS